MAIGIDLALKIFERDSYTCQYCGEVFSEEQPPLHCHHRIFVSQGGRDEERNLTSCCWRCHHNHGKLKGKKLLFEDNYDKINELKQRYAIN